MSKRIIHRNPGLKKRSDLLMSIAKATVTSFSLEGIHITLEDALKMAKKSADKLRLQE